MPFALSSACRRTSSWKFVFPPSMIVSPGSRCSISSAIWASVASPAGTMIQTARGFSSFSTSSAIEKAAIAPSPAISLVFSGVRLYATTSWPSPSRRRTMLAPIRPRPTNPIRIRCASLSMVRPASIGALARVCGGSVARERLAEDRLQRDEPALGVGEVDAEDRQVVGLDRREVALGLGVDQAAERVRPARDRPIVRVVRGELEEPADRRAALVELAGRMEEARPVAGGRGAVGRVAEHRADPIHGFRGRVGRRDERLEGEVGVRLAPGEVPGKLADDRPVA